MGKSMSSSKNAHHNVDTKIQRDENLKQVRFRNINGKSNGFIQGFVIGQAQGKVDGKLDGYVQGRFDGEILGGFSGKLKGTLKGQVEEMGKSPQKIEQYVNGGFQMKIRGKFSGQIVGYVTGQLQGKIDGLCKGEIRGKIDGKATGKINGKVRGKLKGSQAISPSREMQKVMKFFTKNERILRLIKLSSPIQQKPLVEHHQIIIQLEHIFILISFTDTGVRLKANFQLFKLVNIRKKNKIIEEWLENQIAKDIKSLGKFLLDNKQKPYNILLWNCQTFTKQLIQLMVKSQN